MMKFLFLLWGFLVLSILSWGQNHQQEAKRHIDSLCQELNVVGLCAVVIKDSFIVGRYTYGEVIH